MNGWEFWIDRGGTFTDIVARDPAGRIHVHKELSENPHLPGDAAIRGIERLLAGQERGGIAAVKVGTTVATNALLERKGAPTVLAITAGHGDALLIGTQARPRLFDLAIVKPPMLYSRVIEVPERIAADGTLVAPLDAAETRRRLQQAFDDGFRAVAIVLMHGYRYSAHEHAVADIARAIGFGQISVSHRVSPLLKLVPRGDTTVADAYLSPVLRRYVDRLAADLAGTRLLVMQSNGGLVEAARVQGKDAVLSGPAGGVIGAAETARAAGHDRVIGFDMGGTSTDVCHVAGDYERSFDIVVAGVRLRAPMLRVHTVAAGGGSLLLFDGHRFRVGPASAGADPGPAAYGRGGPLTVTDANVLLGRLQPTFFPRVFGPAADAPLDVAAVEAKFAALARNVAAATGGARTPEELAEGFLAIAIDNMARAIRKITVERGFDVTLYTLACFGGAGGQHACRVADSLGIARILVHPLAGALSAYGIGLAPLRAIRERSVEADLTAGADEIDRCITALREDVTAALEAQGIARGDMTLGVRLHLRYAGTDTPLPVPAGDAATVAAAFVAAHRAHFGFDMPGRGIVCALVEAEAAGGGGRPEAFPVAATPGVPAGRTAMACDGRRTEVPVYERAALARGQDIAGPALIAEATATTIVEPGWRATVDAQANLILTRTTARSVKGVDTADPLRIELFNNLFMSIAEQMGAVLQNTAQSVNIKERLDFSCAVFDGAGNLIANAPHMPVHLGSMGDSVRAIVARHPAMQPGDSFVLNNPFAGGTHLPDITVVTPVFLDGDAEPSFFVASRGHHADIGGITPGSMPPESRTLAEEGVLLDGLVLVRGGVFQEAAIRAALCAGPYPARAPEQNLADLRAQAAANLKGVAELRRVAAELGRDAVIAAMARVQDHAEEAVRRVIGRLRSGSFTAPMDDGASIVVAVSVDTGRRSAHVDFTGTSPQRPGNFNAPASICRAAVLYVFRTLVADDIPMNEGCMRPLTLVIPEGCLLNPRPTAPLAAVVAGNVETSQIVCDALYGALGVLAASQGTMNNFTFGDAQHQYYETVCGGAGAGADFDGADAVQTHMTNSRLTDPEVLESRFPVLVTAFGLRRGSGGAGRRHGGDGVVRAIRFRAPMTAAILSGRRRTAPFGLAGGGPALPGETVVTRADGSHKVLAATETVAMAAGDTIVIATPGGGGFGVPGDL
jgi:5-oxoprolinase (ATP-hydrolysing)